MLAVYLGPMHVDTDRKNYATLGEQCSTSHLMLSLFVMQCTMPLLFAYDITMNEQMNEEKKVSEWTDE